MDEKARKVWSKEEIKAGLVKNDSWVTKAVVKLHQLQTAEEQVTESTRYKNNVGFNSYDAQVLSGFARQLQDGFEIKAYQVVYLRKKVLKYAGQLAKLANGKL